MSKNKSFTAPGDIFDRAMLRRRRAKSSRSGPECFFLHDRTAGQLRDRLKDIKRNFCNVIYSGLRGSQDSVQAIKDDTGAAFCVSLDNNVPLVKTARTGAGVVADEDFLPFKEQHFDLFISNLSLHAVNDLPGALIQIRRLLKPDGLFLGAVFGGETLYELRQVIQKSEMHIRGGLSPRIHPVAEKQDMAALLQRAGLNLPVVDSDLLTVTYPDFKSLIRDVRDMGEGNALIERNKNYPGRDLFDHAARLYEEQFKDRDGRLQASFEVIYLIGWAAHESQQKPLRPGSAEKRLADALETKEFKTGVKINDN